MKSKNLISKIAFGIAAAALVFAIVTLIRSIVTGTGILLASIIVIGTAIVVAICAIMLYVLRNYEDDEPDNEPEDKPDETVRAKPKTKKAPVLYDAGEEEKPADPKPDEELREKDIEAEVDRIIADLSRDDSYDLSNFE